METKRLSSETISRLSSKYEKNFFDAMTEKETVARVLSFAKRAKEQGIELTYEEAYFAPRGLRVVAKGEETRIFIIKSGKVNIVPLRSGDAEGDWQSWLKGAEAVNEIEGWRDDHE